MIKANELRIGNYIRLNKKWLKDNPKLYNTKSVIKIRTLNYDELYKQYYPNGYGFYYLDPIPLTEEILFKCGFKRFGKSLRLNTFEYCTLSKNLVIHGQGGYYTGIILKIQYLHQLQNLYFAITGEELTVKL